MNDVVIIIDLLDWYYLNSIPFTRTYVQVKSIESLIKTNTNIKTVILASYDVSSTEYYSNSIWYQNSRAFLGEKLFEEKATVFLGNEDEEKTHLLMKNFSCSAYQIAMHYEWELKKYLAQNKVDNIYVCGDAWDQCVEHRPLGYRSLLNVIDPVTNILVKDTTVRDSKKRFFIPQESPNWEPTDTPGIYKWNKR